MRNFLFFLSLLLSTPSLFAQCDSVQITMSHIYGDCDETWTKKVKHFSPSGKLLFSEIYKKGHPEYIWKPYSREYFIYNSNNSLINHTCQSANGNGWMDIHRFLFSYNSYGSITSSSEENFNSNSWQIQYVDSNTYDGQNNLLSKAHYAPGPITKNIFINNATDTTVIIQQGDSTGTWINISKHERYFNGSLLIQEIINLWINNAWTSSLKTIQNYTGNQLDSTSTYRWTNNMWVSMERTLYSYSGGLADSILTQIMNTVWENQTLIVNLYSGSNLYQVYEMHWVDTSWVYDALTTRDYDGSGRIIRNYNQTWQDTIWINIISSIYEYGPLNRIIHTYTLTGNDTGWVYESLAIDEIDQNGFYTYRDEKYADYNGGIVYWCSLYGPSYTEYTSTGLLISCHGSNIPGGPYNANYNYLDGFIIESHSHSETMGGLETNIDTYGYLADVNGESVLCAGGFTTLYADSCSTYQYHWSTGATTASIHVANEGAYGVTVTHPSGNSYQSPTVRVKIVSHLPYMPMGADSTVFVCGNRSLQIKLPTQNGVSYQWFRNDSALNNYNTSSTTFYGSYLAEGEHYLCATNACGTDTSASTFIQILPYPSNPTITPGGNLTVCSGDTLQLTSSPGMAYEWYPGGQTTQSISVYNSGSYRVFVFDSAGCRAESQSIYVTGSNFNSTPVIILHNGNLQTFYEGNHQWFLNGDTIPGANQSVLTPAQQGDYTLGISDSYGCVKWTNTIYINPGLLNVSIPHTNYICENGSVQLGGTSPVAGGIPPYYYSWSTDNLTFLPGGSMKNVSNLTIDQTYYLKVRDSIGNLAVDSVHVIVVHPVKPLLSGLSNCLLGFNPLRIINYNTDYSVQQWIVNGVPFRYPVDLNFSGIYQVLIHDQYNCPVWSDPDTIYLDPPPAFPQIHATLDPYACTNGSGILWVNSTPGYTYKWSMYSNFILGTDTVLNVNFPVQYKLEVTDSNGCSSSDYFNFNLEDENIEMIILSDFNAAMCESDSFEFKATVIAGWTYKWYDIDDNFLDTGTTLTVNTPGAYTCIATSPTGCTASETVYYSQYSSHIITIIDSAGALYAPGFSYTSYQWYRNGVEIPGAMNRYFVPVNSGAYYVRLHDVGHGVSCHSYSNTIYIGLCSVNVNNSLTCTSQCSGELIATGSGTGILQYSWSDGNTLSALSNLCEGTYIITITDSLGCVARDTAQVVSDGVAFSLINLDPTCNGCADGQIMIQGDNSFISWQPNTGTLIGNTIINLTGGIYNVCVSDTNQCILCISDTLIEPPLGINDISTHNLNYFPNPVSEKITISGLPEVDSFDILIYDNTGRQVDSNHTLSNILDVSNFVPGIYTVAYRNVRNIYHLKFIKN